MKALFSVKQDGYPLLKLAIPLALTGMVQSAVWFFETLFLAHLGPEILAAGALVSWLFGTLAVILFGALSAINILVAHRYGEGDHQGVALIARDGLLLAVLLTLPAFVLFWNMSPVFLWLGQTDSVVALARAYLHALAFGLFANFITIACLEVIIGIGHARVILLFSTLSVILELLFSYALIFGKWGFPAYGIVGAGWGMSISYWLIAIFLIAYLFWSKPYRPYFRLSFSLHKPVYLAELLKIGLPTGVMYCVEVAFFLALTLAMGLIGSQMQAANQIALQYLGLFMAAAFSISQAVTVRMGHLLGAKNPVAAEKASHVGVTLAVILTLVIALFYCFAPTYLIAIDLNLSSPENSGIIADIKQLLLISAIFQVFEAVRIVFFGSLRGLQDTNFTLFTSIISFWFIALPLGYLLALQRQWGGVGFWWGMVLGAVFSVIVLHWRFKSKMTARLLAPSHVY
jgi:MATE family multidrug resistance protein